MELFSRTTVFFLIIFPIWMMSVILIEARNMDLDEYDSLLPKDKRGAEFFIRRVVGKRGAEFFIRRVVGKRNSDYLIQ
uniref:Neuropeptide-18 n=1 Tax=Schmidtea mediterranea TaxID=79327 RepID=E3CTK2_SCHMD|nr:TPA_inf: neuropeptide precursor-18 [Schmidtea mediterranea]